MLIFKKGSNGTRFGKTRVLCDVGVRTLRMLITSMILRFSLFQDGALSAQVNKDDDHDSQL
jgi:hypothetical protein